jgi:hypothetical protein
MQQLPGWTVQCLNPECAARGHWLRVEETPQECCGQCGGPLHRVSPPLAPRFRMRARPLASYRPMGRRR